VLQKAELSCEADSENNLGGSSVTMYYIGLDVHKRTISYCVKDAAGRVHMEGKVGATRRELDAWIKTFPEPRTIAMEATIFTGWIYDHLVPHAEKVKVAHPLMLRAIAAAKRKNDKIDANKIADCLRCDFLPECYMTSTEIRDRRRIPSSFLKDPDDGDRFPIVTPPEVTRTPAADRLELFTILSVIPVADLLDHLFSGFVARNRASRKFQIPPGSYIAFLFDGRNP
jgi:hypothetical protein